MAASSTVDLAPARPRLEATSPRYGEKAIKAFLLLCAVLSVATTAAIVVALLEPTVEFFAEVGLGEFFLEDEWFPGNGRDFGVQPLLVGSLNVALWSMVVAVPLGLGAAVYLSEYASRRVRKAVKPVLEILAGVPTVAIGLFGVTAVTPWLQDSWPGRFLGGPPGFFNALAAAICLGLMATPIVSSVSEDAMSSVPAELRQGAYALGASRMRVATRVVFPAALSGVVASIVLAVSRVVGETMIVLMVAGNNPNMTLNPVEAVQAITAFIGVQATGDAPPGTPEYGALFSVGAVLFAITFTINIVSIRLVRRFREVYE
jgi:phosphate transport system permease protein